MDPTQTASLTSLLMALGLGKYAAGILSLVTLWFAIAPQVMAFLPVASMTSGTAYRVFYGLMAWTTGNHSANAPVPLNGLVAGGMVPSPAKATPLPIGGDPTHKLTTSGGAVDPMAAPKPPGGF